MICVPPKRLIHMDQATGRAALQRLEPFVGEWSVEASFPGAPQTGLAGTTVFEWMLGGQFLLQRSEVPNPDVPDGLLIIAFDPGTESYTQHYFDSRGVVRLYAMTFSDGVWTLLRDSADFSPLDFWQRFTGTFGDDGNAIRGRWEKSRDGSSWELDFELTYTRVR
jgi:hypothetical protein